MSFQTHLHGHRDLREGETGAEYAEKVRIAHEKVRDLLTAADIGYNGGSVHGQVAGPLEPIVPLTQDLQPEIEALEKIAAAVSAAKEKADKAAAEPTSAKAPARKRDRSKTPAKAAARIERENAAREAAEAAARKDKEAADAEADRGSA